MGEEYLRTLEPEHQRAVNELTDMIARKYPGTSFRIGPGVDDDEATHITAIVDLQDPDEVMDLVINRLVAIQVDENLPISVIPVRTAERAAEIERDLRNRLAAPTLPPAVIF